MQVNQNQADTQSKIPSKFTAGNGSVWLLLDFRSGKPYYEFSNEGAAKSQDRSKGRARTMVEATTVYKSAQSEQQGGNKPVDEPAEEVNIPDGDDFNRPVYEGEITAEDLLNRKAEEMPCLIGKIMPKVGLAAVVGSSDTGKSSLLRQLAFCVCTQDNFLGHLVKAKWRSAIFVSTEDDEMATSILLKRLNKSLRVNPAHGNGLRFIFDTHDLLKQLDKRLTDNPADLVIIDAFGDLYTGDANKSNQIRQFLHDYSQLAQKHQCLVLWLHHTGKRTDDDVPSKHNAIGGQGFEAKMRLLMELRKDYHDPDKRHLCITKGNYLPSEYKESSYVLTFENFLFQDTGERVPFDHLARPKEPKDPDAEGKAKYAQIQEARKSGLEGQALADRLGWTKGYISKIEARFGPKTDNEAKVS
ncbi:AAA family ATPase [Spirosoma areae]